MGTYLFTVVETWDASKDRWTFHFSNHDDDESNPLFTSWKDYGLHRVMRDFSAAQKEPSGGRNRFHAAGVSAYAMDLFDDRGDCDVATVAELFDGSFPLLERLEAESKAYERPCSIKTMRDRVLPELRRLGPADKVRIVWGFD